MIKEQKSDNGIKLPLDKFSVHWPPRKSVKKGGLINLLNKNIYTPKSPYVARFFYPGFTIRKTIIQCAGYALAFALCYAIFWLCWALIAVEGL